MNVSLNYAETRALLSHIVASSAKSQQPVSLR